MKYDVAIIGGGLAGLSLSIDLKNRGLDVLVLEKGTYPRHKVCGEYVSMESHAYLHRICPDLNHLALPYISKFHLSSTRKNDFKTNLDLGGFGISRYTLEEMLYLEAIKQGVVFRLKTKVTKVNPVTGTGKDSFEVKTQNETFFSSLVCNSTGRKSNLESVEKDVQNLGTNYVGVKYHVALDREKDFIEIHNFSGGYCGISNIEDGKTCVCYIVNANKLKQCNSSIKEMEEHVLYKNRFIKSAFESAKFLFKEPVTISGINFNIQETISDGSYFLGDAAGRIAPVTGNGMSMGLRSASFLAEEIERYFSGTISNNELGTQYSKFWENEFSSRVKLSRYFQKLSEYPVLSNLSIGAFGVFPKLADPLIKASHGKPF